MHRPTVMVNTTRTLTEEKRPARDMRYNFLSIHQGELKLTRRVIGFGEKADDCSCCGWTDEAFAVGRRKDKRGSRWVKCILAFLSRIAVKSDALQGC